MRRVSLAAACVLCPSTALAQSVTFQGLLKEMTDRGAVARYPSPAYTCAQASSYDRASVAPGADSWFANGDVNQFIREETNEGRREWVLLDAAGPGVIVRFWSANPPEGAVVRFYIDGAARPALGADMQGLLGGTLAVEGVPIGPPLAGVQSKGWNLYLPISYAKHCKVTCDKPGFYYQINTRTYEAGTRIDPFSTTLLAVNRAALADAQAALATVRDPAADPPAAEPVVLSPGETWRWANPRPGPGAVTRVLVRVAADTPADALRATVIGASFDGEACVWCPLSDFFGSGVGLNPYQDWYRGVDAQGRLESRWVMPFREDAGVTLTNHGERPVTISCGVETGPWAWDERSMHFHATWRREYPIHAAKARGTEDWNYVTVAGKGVYVGDNLSVMNPVAAWWGEGDEKVYVDGEKFPSHFGTGTEDYYGYAWCWPEPFAHPFHAQVRADGWKPRGRWTNWGYTAVTRTRSLDAIPFTKGLRFDMEVWHWAACDEEYAATAYWYARPGATSNRGPSVEDARAPIPVPPPLPGPMKIAGAVECETCRVVAHSQGLVFEGQEMEGFTPRTWSGGEHLWVKATRAGDYIEIEVPASGDGPRELVLHATKSWDYGVVRCTVNGRRAGPDLDLCSGKEGRVEPTGPIVLGRFEPEPGAGGAGWRLRVEVVGANEKSVGARHFFGLDAVVARP